MAEQNEQQLLDRITTNAKRFAGELDSGLNITESDIVSKALSLPGVREAITKVILQVVKAGIEHTKELDYQELKSELLRLFSNPDIIHADSSGRLNLRQSIEGLVGDEKDLADGLAAARDMLGLKGNNPIEERARFWKLMYTTARENASAPSSVKSGKKLSFKDDMKESYDKTIQARVESFGGLAPYWLMMERGMTDQHAYPNYGPLLIVEAMQLNAQHILDNAIIRVNEDVENLITQELERFIERPDEHQPGTVLKEFFSDSQRYLIHVTPKGRIGVRKARSKAGVT